MREIYFEAFDALSETELSHFEESVRRGVKLPNECTPKELSARKQVEVASESAAKKLTGYSMQELGLKHEWS